MILAVVLAFALVAVTFALHYRVLLWLGENTPKLKLPTHTQVLVIVVVLFLTHIVEIGIYAVTYSLSVTSFELGTFRGSPVTDAMSYLYYSGVVYTTLGLGDIQPEGHIRFITAMEALNGFLLITWSASFTFLAMGRLWPWDNSCSGQNNS
ncbi:MULTISPECIES: ion channel [Spongiibacter]|uniref:ion channel n=1 Tax=Spongiibacter TaxID=630749 RepID=UPI000C0A3AA9|nr:MULTISPECIES: ion channel [unclassified Spongiibacter]MAK42646.1 transporter [Spongiibacter sp.]